MKRLLIVLCLLFVLFCGCRDQITEGEVYYKEYQPESTNVIMMPMTVYHGDNSYSTVSIPMSVYDDPDWIIDIKAYDGEKDRSRRIYVSCEVFDKTPIGSWFVIANHKDSAELSDPHVKRRATKKEARR